MTIIQPATVQPVLSAVWYWLTHTVDWGNAQELITWIVAGFALIFAAKAASAAHRTDMRQAEQLQELADDKRSAQAEKVAAWHEWVTEQRQSGSIPRISAAMGYHAFIVRNASDVPIYSAWVAASGPGRELKYFSVENRDVIPPGSTPIAMKYRQGVKPHEVRPRVLMLFRDAAGHYWIRRENGLLDKCDEETWDTERSILLYTQADNEELLAAEDRAARYPSKEPES